MYQCTNEARSIYRLWSSVLTAGTEPLFLGRDLQEEFLTLNEYDHRIKTVKPLFILNALGKQVENEWNGNQNDYKYFEKQ